MGEKTGKTNTVALLNVLYHHLFCRAGPTRYCMLHRVESVSAGSNEPLWLTMFNFLSYCMKSLQIACVLVVRVQTKIFVSNKLVKCLTTYMHLRPVSLKYLHIQIFNFYTSAQAIDSHIDLFIPLNLKNRRNNVSSEYDVTENLSSWTFDQLSQFWWSEGKGHTHFDHKYLNSCRCNLPSRNLDSRTN